MACAAAAAYHLTLWCQTGSYRQLAATASAALLASVTSYTGWALALATAVVVWYAAWHREPGTAAERCAARKRTLSSTACRADRDRGWLAWNAEQSGSPLNFIGGATTRRRLGAGRRGCRRGAALADGVGLAVLVAAVLGFGYYLAITRLRPQVSAAGAARLRALHCVRGPSRREPGQRRGHRGGGPARGAVLRVPHRRRSSGTRAEGAGYGCGRDYRRHPGADRRRGHPGAARGEGGKQQPGHGRRRAGRAWLRAHYTGGLVLMQLAGTRPCCSTPRPAWPDRHRGRSRPVAAGPGRPGGQGHPLDLRAAHGGQPGRGVGRAGGRPGAHRG